MIKKLKLDIYKNKINKLKNRIDKYQNIINRNTNNKNINNQDINTNNKKINDEDINTNNKNINNEDINTNNEDKNINNEDINTNNKNINNEDIKFFFESLREDPNLKLCETKQFKAIINNIFLNKYAYITLLVSFFFLSTKKNYKSLVNLFITFVAISFIGYLGHAITHKLKASEVYDNFDVITKKSKFLNSIVKVIVYYIDFHRDTHHDTSINKKPVNFITEFILNFLSQGGGHYFLFLLLKYCESKILLIYGFLYCTIHMINYNIKECPQHVTHHINSNQNYGFDIYDIIMGTKKDMSDIEDYNHYAINIIIITLIFYYFT